MIKISLKGLAKFMTASPANQRKVLRDFKYPDPEGHAQATYYREARDYISEYHKKGYKPQWLIDKAKVLIENSALVPSRRTQIRYKNNARSLYSYCQHFGNKSFDILPVPALGLSFNGVTITVFPDLHVQESGRDNIIKLEFSKETPEERVVKIINQIMFEAQLSEGMDLLSSGVLLYDVPRGHIYRGARVGARMRSEIEAACSNIAAIWDGI